MFLMLILRLLFCRMDVGVPYSHIPHYDDDDDDALALKGDSQTWQ
jgi:hypothetical protein